MIINQEQSNAVVTGEIKNNRVGIDVNNINFITNLLTSSLYSFPIESFLRETVANAWDSQVEAGNVNTPILIKISSLNEDDITISIRDYGTGLSPERFDEIYRNIGSSTKRSSNEFIGCLGIGRFASLAVSDVVSIKSYYNGLCYSYLMYKDGETLNIDLLNTTETKYENGVDVQVTVKDAYYSARHIIGGLALLAYFEQIYIDTDVAWLLEFVKRFNERTVHNFNTFKVCSLNEIHGLHFLMGNVLYKCSDNAYKSFKNDPSIAISCNIGEVDVTPNREGLRYNERTKQNISEKVTKAENEIYEICNNLLTGDFQTITEWNNIMNKQCFRAELWKFPENELYVEVTPKQLEERGIESKCTIRGKAVPNDLMFYYNSITFCMVPASLFTYKYSNQQFCRPDKIPVNGLCNIIRNGRSFYLHEPYKPITKQYFREYVSSEHCMMIRKDQLKVVFKTMLRDYYKYVKSCDKRTFQKDTIRLVLEEIFPLFSSIKDFNNSDVPKQWIAEQKEQKEKKAAAKRRDCVCYELCSGRDSYDYGSERSVSSTNYCTLECYRKYEGTVVYAERKSEDLRFMFRISRYGNFRNIIFIEVAKSNLPLVQQQCKHFISVEDFMVQRDKRLSRLFTGVYLKRKYPAPSFVDCASLTDYSKIIKDFERMKELTKYAYFRDEFAKDFQELYEYYVSKGWIDTQWDDVANDKTLAAISKFLEKIGSPSNLKCQVAQQIAFNFFVLKHRLHCGEHVNPISAYKFLKTI